MTPEERQAVLQLVRGALIAGFAFLLWWFGLLNPLLPAGFDRETSRHERTCVASQDRAGRSAQITCRTR